MAYTIYTLYGDMEERRASEEFRRPFQQYCIERNMTLKEFKSNHFVCSHEDILDITYAEYETHKYTQLLGNLTSDGVNAT